MPEHLIPLYNLENRFRISQLWGVKYRFGAKFESISEPHPMGHCVDCSGYTRWLVLHGSNGELLLPDGSVNQHAFVLQKGFPIREYSKALLNRSDAVYICFFRPAARLASHVWLLHNGRTMESRWGKGISSRGGSILGFMGRKVYCYRLN
jgi:cell wall-associated NlpC family hydrolase